MERRDNVIETSGQAVMPQQRAERHHPRFSPHNVRMTFRRWRRTRPFWGGLWAVLGGLIIAAGPASAIKLLIAAGTTVWLGTLVGALVTIFGLFLWYAPQQRQLIGVLIAVLSVVSLITSDFGGFLIGMLLGITGGAMGFAWVPSVPKQTAVEVTGTALVAGEVEKTGTEVERTPAAAEQRRSFRRTRR